MNAEETLARHAPQIEEALVEALPSGPDTPPDLLEAMRYSLMAGGKRLQPTLVLLAAEACGAEQHIGHVGGSVSTVLPFP